MSAIGEFAELITGDGRARGYLELRIRQARDDRWHRSFVGVAARRALERSLPVLALRGDAYVGTVPRWCRSGKRDAARHGWTLWADCDTPDAVRALDAFAIPPSLIIASGTAGHVHAYWGLSRPLDGVEIETANRRLAVTLGADPAVANCNAILRPPDTLNHKTDPPRPVTVIKAWAMRVDPHILLAACRELPAPVQLAPAGPRSWTSDLLDVSPDEYVRVLLGVEVPASRKVRCPGFHDDTTPSLHVYETPERGWYCFGCGLGGTIYDLAAVVWHLPTRGPGFRELDRRLRECWRRDAA